MADGRRIAFGPFQLDPENERVWRGDEEVILRPKSFALLRYLLEHNGRLVTKEELLKTLWAGTVVSEGVLKVCVREVREALGERAKSPEFIETVPRRGYRFIAPVSASTGARAEGERSEAFARIVGRQEELETLQRSLQRAERGERQLVFVTGAPGIGKTTLVDLFLCSTQVQDRMRVGLGQCLERYGEGEAYLPVLEALGRLCREPGGNRLIELLRQFAPTWLVQMPALMEDTEFEKLQRKVQGTTHERMLREVTETVEAFAVERGLVLVLEDLQWSDYSTLEIISYLAHRRERARLMVLGTYRPADVARAEHPLQGIKRELHAHGQCEEIPLKLLTEGEVQEYVTRALAPVKEPPGLGRLIHNRTDGNPLFMVNLVDFAVTQGQVATRDGEQEARLSLDEFERSVPDSLRHVIQKQVEALGTEVLPVLESASVAGLEFAAATVAAASRRKVEEIEACCDAMARRGHVLCPKGVEVWPDGTASARYRFIHRLTQQVLYEQMGDAQRMRVHRLIAKRKEAGYKEQAHEIAGELALHFERGRDQERAVRYHRQAGENDLRLRAYQEAAHHIRRGLEILVELPDTPARAEEEIVLQSALARALIPIRGPGDPEVQEVRARAWALCQHVGETHQLAPVLLGMASSHGVYGRLRVAEEVAEQALRVAERAKDPVLILSAHCELGTILFWRGEISRAREHLEQSAAASATRDEAAVAPFAFDIKVRFLSILSLLDCVQGYPDSALAKSEEAIGLAEEVSSPFDLASARLFAALIHQFRREGAQAVAQAEAAIDLGAEHGFPLAVAGATILKGWGLAVGGTGKAGISLMQEGMDAWKQSGIRLLTEHFAGLVAEAQGRLGQIGALATIDGALDELGSTGGRIYGAELYRLKGALMLGQLGDAQGGVGAKRGTPKGCDKLLADGEECIRKALDIARHQGAKMWELRAAMSLARLLRARGEEKGAHRELEHICSWFTEGSSTPDLREARALLKNVPKPVGRVP